MTMTGRKSTKSNLDSSSSKRIMEAAASLFAARGFHQTAMMDVAERAGVSVGLIYRYFSNKEDMIATVAEREVRLWESRMIGLVDNLQFKRAAPPDQLAMLRSGLLWLPPVMQEVSDRVGW